MPKNLLFVCNPTAGRVDLKSDLLDLVDVLTRGGYRVTVHPTQCAGDAVEVIQETGSAYDAVAISGGDGTLNEAVNGLMALPPEQRPPLCYIPAGSTNDFAASLAIPKDRRAAALSAIRGTRFPCDVGRFNGKYFTYVAAFGAFTDVAYDTPQRAKNLMGHVAYLLEGVKRLPLLRAWPLTLTAGDLMVAGEFVFGMVSNTNFVGGLPLSLPEVSLQDGMLEVLLIRNPRTFPEAQTVLAKLAAGDYFGPQFVSFKAPSVCIQTPVPVEWTLDGEYGGAHTTVQIDVCSHATTFFLPRPRKGS